MVAQRLRQDADVVVQDPAAGQPHLPIVREAVASGLDAVYAVSACLGLAGGVIVRALVRRPRAASRVQPEQEAVAL